MMNQHSIKMSCDSSIRFKVNKSSKRRNKLTLCSLQSSNSCSCIPHFFSHQYHQFCVLLLLLLLLHSFQVSLPPPRGKNDYRIIFQMTFDQFEKIYILFLQNSPMLYDPLTPMLFLTCNIFLLVLLSVALTLRPVFVLHTECFHYLCAYAL